MLLLDELRDAWDDESRDHRVALAAIILAGIALRLLHLTQPIRYDEAFAYLEFARYPLSDAVARYQHHNNHVFHTVLVKVSVALFGDAPWALRMPAFVAGVAVIPASYAVARVLYGARSALLAAAIVAASGMLTLYATNARGYSMVVLAFLLLVLIAVRLQRAPTARPWIAFAVVAALGVWAVPVMLFPLGAVALWLALAFVVDARWPDLRSLAVALAGFVALAAVAFLPVVSRNGFSALIRNQNVASSPWPEFLAAMVESVRNTAASWGLGLPPLVTAALALCAVVALARHATLARSRVSLPLAAFVWCAWLLVVSHRAPDARVWLWALPLGAALAAAGASALLDQWNAKREFIARRWSMIAVAFALAASASVGLSGAVRLSRDTGTFVEAREVAAALRVLLRPGDRVVAAVPTSAPLAYHLQRLGFDSTFLTRDESVATRLLVVIDQSEGQSLGAIVRSRVVNDTTRFASSIVARYPRTTVMMFARRQP